MSDQTTLERNLLSVSVGDPEVSGLIQRADPSPQFRLLTARNGDPVPAIVHDGHLHALHSQMDPRREAERLTGGFVPEGYCVCFGLGAGYHLHHLLEAQSLSSVLVIESDVSLVRSAMEVIDYRLLFLDPRVRLLIDPTPETLRRHLLATFLPAVTGGLNTFTLRSRATLCSGVFQEMAAVLREAIGEIADDYTVQCYFGKRWFSNIVANLPLAEQDTVTLGPTRTAWVVAAGPSLEDQIEELPGKRDATTMVISTDTALRALLAVGITPDIVVSIDCQHVSYHHFLGGYPAATPLVLDLASPPGIARRAERRVFFSSGHPFSRYINDKLRPYPLLDTSGGNVTHAAVSLADALGARDIYLVGADYSYPDGKTYARGTYLYPYFSAQASRVRPLESRFVAFLLRSDSVRRERSESGMLYTTKPLSGYKERLERLVAGLGAAVHPLPGRGLPIVTPADNNRSRARSMTIFSPGASRREWEEFLSDYRGEVAALPPPRAAYGRYVRTLTAEQQTIVTTMLPVIAAIRHERTHANSPSQLPSSPRDADHIPLSDLFSAARSWIDLVIARAIREASR